MRIEISDKQYWIEKCNLALANIRKRRVELQIEYNSKSWFYKLIHDAPMPKYDDLRTPKWNSYGEWQIADLKQKLEYPNCDAIIINPYEHQLEFVLNWSE